MAWGPGLPGGRATVAGMADQQVALFDQRDAPQIVARAVAQPLRGDVAAHVDIAVLHGLLQAQAGHHMVLRAHAYLAGEGLDQVEQDALHRLLLLGAHQRHAPAFGDGEAQHWLLGQALGGPQQQQGQDSAHVTSSLICLAVYPSLSLDEIGRVQFRPRSASISALSARSGHDGF